MALLMSVARWEATLLIAALGIVTLWKILTTAKLASLIQAADGTLSPGRVQMLVLTIVTAMQYLIATMHDPTHLPVLPSNLVTALGGSHVVYLGAKAWSKFGPGGNKGDKSEN
jgi:hypothetical protein